MRRTKDLRRALRARTLRIVRAERGCHPRCVLVWTMSADELGHLVVRFLCLSHDATWGINIEAPYASINPGSTLDSRCPPVRTVDASEHATRVEASLTAAAEADSPVTLSHSLPLFPSRKE